MVHLFLFLSCGFKAGTMLSVRCAVDFLTETRLYVLESRNSFARSIATLQPASLVAYFTGQVQVVRSMISSTVFHAHNISRSFPTRPCLISVVTYASMENTSKKCSAFFLLKRSLECIRLFERKAAKFIGLLVTRSQTTVIT